MRADPQFRYEELAAFITRMVDNGTLRPGSRAPSVREIGRQHRASLTTVLQAYRLLEDRGVLEARPRSGFFVSARPRVRLPEPAMSQPPQVPGEVSISNLVMELFERAGDPSMAPLGCAVPDASLLATGGLDRLLARAARTQGKRYNGYTQLRGDPQLRQEIARRAMRVGQALDPDEMIITCGCTEALNLALRAVATPGDTIAIESPTYFGLLHLIEALGLKVLELPTHADTGIDLDALRQALGHGGIKACLFASSFNNPLGCTIPESRKLAILDLLARHEVPLIEDDIYGEIYFGAERPRPFITLANDRDVIYCSSFSKTLAPGYRVGWLAAGARMSQLLMAKLTTSLCGPALPQVALAGFLSGGGYDAHLRRLRRQFEDNIERMRRGIQSLFPAGTRVSNPAGGFVLWLELPAALDCRALFERALAEGVCFAPGDLFAASGRYRHCLRLSCGHPWSEPIENALATLAGLVEAEMTKARSAA